MKKNELSCETGKRLAAAKPELLNALKLAQATIVRLATYREKIFSSTEWNLEIIRNAITKLERIDTP